MRPNIPLSAAKVAAVERYDSSSRLSETDPSNGQRKSVLNDDHDSCATRRKRGFHMFPLRWFVVNRAPDWGKSLGYRAASTDYTSVLFHRDGPIAHVLLIVQECSNAGVGSSHWRSANVEVSNLGPTRIPGSPRRATGARTPVGCRARMRRPAFAGFAGVSLAGHRVKTVDAAEDLSLRGIIVRGCASAGVAVPDLSVSVREFLWMFPDPSPARRACAVLRAGGLQI